MNDDIAGLVDRLRAFTNPERGWELSAGDVVDTADVLERLLLANGALSQDNEGQHWELVALRSIVRKLVIEPADTIGPAYHCAAWLDATEHEVEVIERALAGPPIGASE